MRQLSQTVITPLFLRFISVTILVATISACSERVDVNSWQYQNTIALLTSFEERSYQYAYECRPQKFKEAFSFSQYVDHLEDRPYSIISEPMEITRIEVLGKYSYVEYVYSAELEGNAVRLKDLVVWRAENSELHCVDSGFRMIYPMNSPREVEDMDYFDTIDPAETL